MKISPIHLGLFALAVLAGCSDTNPPNEDRDSGASARDAGGLSTDSGFDSGHDDGGADAGPTTDAGADAAPDAGATDAGVDAHADAGPPDLCALREPYPDACIIDYDDDGVSPIERRLIFTYAGGRVTSARTYAFTGELIYEQLTTYDDLERTLTRSTDSNADGTPEQVERERRDEVGRLIETFYDLNVDGTWDSCTTTEFSTDGRTETMTTDGGCDGVDANVLVTERDAMGRVIRIALDQGDDGDTDTLTTTVYAGDGLSYVRTREELGSVLDIEHATLNAAGKVLEARVDDGGNGSIERTYVYTYDVRGHLIRTLLTSVTPAFTYLQTWTVDECGLILLAESDYGADGTVEERYESTFDEEGNPITYVVDNPAGGPPESIVGYNYACWE